MDSVKITLQNKELIESIINNSKNIDVAVHNAIIDGITKRLIKNVANETNLEKHIKEATKKIEDEISAEYLLSKKGQFGYGTVYELKEEYQSAVDNAVRKAFSDIIDEKVKQYTEPAIRAFEKRINDKIESIDINEMAKRAVAEAVELRFGRP